jgi:hypothetical protein
VAAVGKGEEGKSREGVREIERERREERARESVRGREMREGKIKREGDRDREGKEEGGKERLRDRDTLFHRQREGE